MNGVKEIQRPALRYYGGKWNLGEWIISHFPEHESYLEPCGGAASVLLQKQRSTLETYNDIDGNVCNFFRVLRESYNELIELLQMTPWAREEFQIAMQPVDNPIEAARRFYVAHWMGISASGLKTSGCRFVKRDNHYIFRFVNDTGQNLQKIAERFLDVQIENRDAIDCINNYDGDNTLIYFDPPYVKETRSHKKEYRHEVEEEFHFEAFEALKQCQSYVVVSGYACESYTETYEKAGWTRFDMSSQTTSGKLRVESVWLSPRTVEALNRPRQVSLFAMMN